MSETKRYKLKIKLNTPLLGKPKGLVLKIECDKEGNPLVKEWRQFVRDSKIDNCLTVLENPIDLEAIKESRKKSTKTKSKKAVKQPSLDSEANENDSD